MSDTDQPDNAADDAGLTKQKKPRSEAQKAAFEKARAAQAAKRAAAEPSPIPDKERKKMILKAVKDKLNGEPKAEVVDESESDDEPEPPPPPKKSHKKKVESPPTPMKAKKEPKVIYEEDSDTEEEVVIVKKRKKPKKKTIIYEEDSDTEDEPQPPKKAAQPSRETKSQQNSKSLFKITPGKAEAPKPIYYFAD
jgi:hypothetical protein